MSDRDIRTYQKKSVQIRAIEWTGSNASDVSVFTHNMVSEWSSTELVIPTLEGNMIASVGDYIIEGVKGEYYPCKPDIFKMTYSEIHEDIDCPDCRENLARFVQDDIQFCPYCACSVDIVP